jgi:hypothetical protein
METTKSSLRLVPRLDIPDSSIGPRPWTEHEDAARGKPHRLGFIKRCAERSTAPFGAPLPAGGNTAVWRVEWTHPEQHRHGLVDRKIVDPIVGAPTRECDRKRQVADTRTAFKSAECGARRNARVEST